MDGNTTLVAALLGILEGATEFIPVSSTAHILLAGEVLGFESKAKTFEIVIQLGAVLAILSLYATRLLGVARQTPQDQAARRFFISIVVACIPAGVLGIAFNDFIKETLFNSLTAIAIVLIVGGVILLIVDRINFKQTHDDAMRLPLRTALAVGLFQCLALMPGTSRSGATIVGAMMMGVSKRAAAEFSFFLTMPVMLGATLVDLLKNWDVLDTSAVWLIAVGFATAFVTAVIVVRAVLAYVTRHGYALFGWWRIAVGVAALAYLHI
jgi:undecaprenyl-diphosphatase